MVCLDYSRFFIIALVSPFINKIVDKISNVHFLVLSIIIFLAVDYSYFIYSSAPLYIKLAFIQMPYFVIFAWGCVLKRLSIINLVFLCAASFVVYLVYASYLYHMNGVYILTGQYKYPPRIYYLAYASFAIIIIWVLRNEIQLVACRLKIEKVLGFIGSHTLWIYFWHVLMILIFEPISIHFLCKFIFVLTFSTITTYIQSCLIVLVSRNIASEFVKRYLNMILNC